MTSYSEYFTDLDPWFEKNLGKDFIQYRTRINSILHEESQLMEIVKLIGADVLPDDQKLVIEIARVIRVGFLQQNAFHPDDTFSASHQAKADDEGDSLFEQESQTADFGLYSDFPDHRAWLIRQACHHEVRHSQRQA